ncbi:thiamine pyrophosphate-dependent enzyme [Fodinicola acaciae]|uniref:thiamine pyrophosphate-dependent enzyme n=1 Tax=Fodinicola acaciae TaxID=2681555 RepID=UPI001C9E76CC|nr:thiamine pyrophosphate-dependent enzyme [Fodinicola acaciae]
MSISFDVPVSATHPIDSLNEWITLGHAADAPAMVAADGTLTGAAAHLLTPDPALARTVYRDMVLARRLDHEATALQRQGELCMWIPSLGQEGAQAGAIRAVRDTDMVFPTYREHTAAIARSVPVSEFLHMFRGVGHAGWDSHKHRFQIYTVVLSAQLLHAVGYGMGIQRDGADEVVLACIGDGATSQGDANEAFVWAAAQSAPVVFFVQNNQYAISVPVRSQSTQPLARRADGFGFPGLRVDGNDPLAVHSAVSAAVECARTGAGPVLVEAVTYRLGPHTTADDPRRYRDSSEESVWAGRDPLARTRTFLLNQGWADEAWLSTVDTDADDFSAEIRSACLGLPDPSADNIFSHVFVEETPDLIRQRKDFAAYQAGFAD